MATIVLSILIFGGAGAIVYRRIKNGSSCEDCDGSCPVKEEQHKHYSYGLDDDHRVFF